MITSNTFSFLSDLKNNNQKEWFEANKNRYKAAQQEIKNLLAIWIKEFGQFDYTIAALEPNKCVFRINRDVRFSKDKSPYKINLGAFLSPGGKNANLAGYYLHIEPGKCFFGTGNYMPFPEQLQKIRQEIDYNFDDFLKIIKNKKFEQELGNLNVDMKLKRAPKGYEEDNPAIEYLKLKSFTLFKPLKDDELMKPNFVKNLVALSKIAMPFNQFLNDAVV